MCCFCCLVCIVFVLKVVICSVCGVFVLKVVLFVQFVVFWLLPDGDHTTHIFKVYCCPVADTFVQRHYVFDIRRYPTDQVCVYADHKQRYTDLPALGF